MLFAENVYINIPGWTYDLNKKRIITTFNLKKSHMLTWKILLSLIVCEFTLAVNILPHFKEALHVLIWSIETGQ